MSEKEVNDTIEEAMDDILSPQGASNAENRSHRIRILERELLQLRLQETDEISTPTKSEPMKEADAMRSSDPYRALGGMNFAITPPRTAGNSRATRYFAQVTEREIDIEYKSRKQEWIDINPITSESQYYERLLISAKTDPISFSGHDVDWPEFRQNFRAMLQACRLLEVAEGRDEDYRRHDAIYSRLLAATSKTHAANHIEGKVAFGDGPSAWAVLCERYDKRSEDRIIFIENDINQMRLSNGGDLNDHLAELSKLFRLLEECGSPIDEATKLRRIKSSLSSAYDNTVNYAELHMSNHPEYRTVEWFVTQLRVRYNQLEHNQLVKEMRRQGSDKRASQSAQIRNSGRNGRSTSDNADRSSEPREEAEKKKKSNSKRGRNRRGRNKKDRRNDQPAEENDGSIHGSSEHPDSEQKAGDSDNAEDRPVRPPGRSPFSRTGPETTTQAKGAHITAAIDMSTFPDRVIDRNLAAKEDDYFDSFDDSGIFQDVRRAKMMTTPSKTSSGKARCQEAWKLLTETNSATTYYRNAKIVDEKGYFLGVAPQAHPNWRRSASNKPVWKNDVENPLFENCTIDDFHAEVAARKWKTAMLSIEKSKDVTTSIHNFYKPKFLSKKNLPHRFSEYIDDPADLSKLYKVPEKYQSTRLGLSEFAELWTGNPFRRRDAPDKEASTAEAEFEEGQDADEAHDATIDDGANAEEVNDDSADDNTSNMELIESGAGKGTDPIHTETSLGTNSLGVTLNDPEDDSDVHREKRTKILAEVATPKTRKLIHVHHEDEDEDEDEDDESDTNTPPPKSAKRKRDETPQKTPTKGKSKRPAAPTMSDLNEAIHDVLAKAIQIDDMKTQIDTITDLLHKQQEANNPPDQSSIRDMVHSAMRSPETQTIIEEAVANAVQYGINKIIRPFQTSMDRKLNSLDKSHEKLTTATATLVEQVQAKQPADDDEDLFAENTENHSDHTSESEELPDQAGKSDISVEIGKPEKPEKPDFSTPNFDIGSLNRKLEEITRSIENVQSVLDRFYRENSDADSRHQETIRTLETTIGHDRETRSQLLNTIENMARSGSNPIPNMGLPFPPYVQMMQPYGSPASLPSPSTRAYREPEKSHDTENRKASMLSRQPPRPGIDIRKASTRWHTALIDSGAAQTVTSIDSGFIDMCRGPPFTLEGISSTVELDTFAEFHMVMQTTNGLILTRWGNVILHPQATSTLLSVKQIKAICRLHDHVEFRECVEFDGARDSF
ncbi:MAG: hypothetical protein AAGM67_00540, partial [Bacteroidota bacterium]